MKNSKIEVPWDWRHSIFLWVIVFLSITGVNFTVILTANDTLTTFFTSGVFEGNFVLIMDLLLTLGFALCITDFRTFVKVEGFRKIGLKWAIIALIIGIIFPFIGSRVGYLQKLFWSSPFIEYLWDYSLPIRPPSEIFSGFLVYVIWVGTCEEVLFRGFIQRGLEKTFSRTNVLIPIFITSFLFAVMHIAYGTAIQYTVGYPWFEFGLFRILPITIESLLFGWFYYKSDHNILVPIIIHGFGDFFAMCLMPFLS